MPSNNAGQGLSMGQQWPAGEIARQILEGFDDHREQFRQITNGGRTRFQQAQWQEIQQASAARINLYEEKVEQTIQTLRQAFTSEQLLDVQHWPLVKSAYITQIDSRFDDELAETWYNSIFAACSAMTRSVTAACSSIPPARHCGSTSGHHRYVLTTRRVI